MSLRCLVFSSDEGTTAILRQILPGLGVEGEFCSSAVTAAGQITNQPFRSLSSTGTSSQKPECC